MKIKNPVYINDEIMHEADVNLRGNDIAKFLYVMLWRHHSKYGQWPTADSQRCSIALCMSHRSVKRGATALLSMGLADVVDGTLRGLVGESVKHCGEHSHENSIGSSKACAPIHNNKSQSITYQRDEFEKFWGLYGKKGSKIDAQKAWLKLTDDEMGEAIDGVGKYHKRFDEPKYRVDACRYISRREWTREDLDGPLKKEIPKSFTR